MKFKEFILAALLATSALANTVTITPLGFGSVVDPQGHLVGPYQLSIDGVSVNSDCYDITGEVWQGQSFQAVEYTLAGAIAGGQFAGNALGYQLVGVLDAIPFSTFAQQVALQDAIWDVFHPGAVPTTPMMAYDAAMALLSIPLFDFSRTVFLEPVVSGPQSFVLQAAPPTGTPEPFTCLMVGAGLFIISRARRPGQKEKNQ